MLNLVYPRLKNSYVDRFYWYVEWKMKPEVEIIKFQQFRSGTGVSSQGELIVEKPVEVNQFIREFLENKV